MNNMTAKASGLFIALGATLMISTGTADAAILAPVTDFITEILSDVQGMITVLGTLALVIGLIAMLFGQGNAWKLAIVGVVIVIAANASEIVSAMIG